MINPIIFSNINNPYYPRHIFDPTTLPLEISISTIDRCWVGRNEPTDKTIKLWIYDDIEGYETITKVGD